MKKIFQNYGRLEVSKLQTEGFNQSSAHCNKAVIDWTDLLKYKSNAFFT